jgi:hypothetical protein
VSVRHMLLLQVCPRPLRLRNAHHTTRCRPADSPSAPALQSC